MDNERLDGFHWDIPRIPENAELFKPHIPIEEFSEEERKKLEEDFKNTGCY